MVEQYNQYRVTCDKCKDVGYRSLWSNTLWDFNELFPNWYFIGNTSICKKCRERGTIDEYL